MNNNIIFVLTGPSGAGKTTYSRLLCEHFSDTCEHNITYTTREPRPEEASTKSFVFITIEEFEQLQKDGYFECSTFFCGNWYGFMRRDIRGALDKGKDLIIDSIMEPDDLRKIGSNIVIVYLTTTTNRELYDRIINRNPQMISDELNLRIENFYWQTKIALQCDYIVNTDISRNQNIIFNELVKIFNEVKESYRSNGNIYPHSLNKYLTRNVIEKGILPYDKITL